MARFLFVVPPFTGHINPTVSVGHLLAERNHDVAWVGHPSKLQPLLGASDRLLPLPEGIGSGHFNELQEKSTSLRGIEAMKFLWQDVLIPLGRQMRAGLEAAVDAFNPTVMVVDQQALAGGLVARRRSLRWATFTTSAAGLIEMPLPLVWQWVLDQMAELQREAGLDDIVERPDISPELMVVFTTKALAGERDYPGHYQFVGPSITARDQKVDFPWEALAKDRPKVLVSLGTVNADRAGPFCKKLVQAMQNQPVQLIVAAAPALMPCIPDNFIVQDYLPQLALLPHVDAVVSHAGQNTVSETLANGLPLVVTPIKDDQGLIASQVVQAGAGVRVRFGRLQAEKLAQAIFQVLNEPTYRRAAERIRASFEAAGGAARAAELLEGFAATQGPL